MKSLCGIALFFGLLSGFSSAEEIPASRVAKVSHAEGFRVKTASYALSEALVWNKGDEKPNFMLIVQHNDGAERYFTITRPAIDVLVGEGAGVKYTLDSSQEVFTIEGGGKKVQEKFIQVIDS